MKKYNAFTMIELVVVLVVMGIIATYSIPRLKRDTRVEAMTQMLHMIRYTQNLALHDSKHLRDKSRWQRAYWKFKIYRCTNNDIFFGIGTNKDLIEDTNDISLSEAAIDPSNGKPLIWNAGTPCPVDDASENANNVSPNIFISQKYGINDVIFSDCQVYKDGATTSDAQHIGFDNFGRPYKSFTATYKPNNWGYAIETCKITFKFADTSIQDFTIDIDNETGYTTIEGATDL